MFKIIKNFLKNIIHPDYHKFFSDSFFSGLSGLINLGVNFVFNIIMAHNLAPQSFGVFTTVISLVYLLAIPSNTLQTMFTKVTGNHIQFDLKPFRDSYLKKILQISTVAAIVVLVVSFFVADLVKVEFKYLALLSVITFSLLFSTLPKGYAMGLQQIKVVSTISIIETVIKLMLGILAIILFSNTAVAILSYGVPVFISGLVLYFVINKINRPNLPALGYIPQIKLNDSLQVLIVLLLASLPYTVDALYTAPEVRPAYSALSLIGKLVFFATSLITSVFFATLTKEQNLTKKKNLVLISCGFSLVTGLILTLIYVFFDKQLVEFFLKNQYQEIIPYLPLYAILMTLYAIAMILNQYLISVNQKKQVFILVVVAILQFVLFQRGNNSLDRVITNQLIVYIGLFIGLLIYWLIAYKREKTISTKTLS